MVFFITVLRAFAACLITNAHYTGIYPSDLIANGGLLGDVLFFAISGYCLYNIKARLSPKGFIQWYGKRIWRVYPPVIVMTAIYMIIGSYQLSPEKGFFWWFLYPTNYHFVASIILLYIPFFFIIKIPNLCKRIPLVMAAIGVVWLCIYFFFYDFSFYHIDTVREPMIRFLFMESMLLGAWLRQNDTKMRNALKVKSIIITVVLFVLYFVSKMVLLGNEKLAPFQFVNQIVLFSLLFFIFRSASGLDNKLESLPIVIKRGIKFVSDMTLEIYVVQYVIIDAIRSLDIVFPINWVILTVCILVSAFLLHFFCGILYGIIEKTLLQRRDT